MVLNWKKIWMRKIQAGKNTASCAAVFPVNFICCFIYFLPSLSGGTNRFVFLRNSAICAYASGGSEKSGLILGAVEIVDSIVWFKVSSDVAVCGNKNNFIGSS